MKVINVTRNTILSENLKICTSLVDCALGLLKPSNPRSLLFVTRFGLHTFGLKAPIDIVVIDSKSIIVKIGEQVKPNKVFFWSFLYSNVMEFPTETVNKTHTKVGDTLKLEP